MSDDEFDGNDSQLVKDLRKQIKDKDKALDELQAQFAPLRASVRQREIADVLTGRGLNAKVAKFVPSDIETANLDSWLQENADVFGFDLTPKEDAPNPEADAQARLANVERKSAPAGQDTWTQRLQSASTQQEFDQIMQEARAVGA